VGDASDASEPRKRALPPVLVQPIKRIKRARAMRRAMSLPEVLLWRELKGKPLGMKFRKQFPVLDYYPDFACLEVRLLVEVDGIAHDMGDRPERDEQRDAELTEAGWTVVRVTAKDVLKDANRVAQSIMALALSLRKPPRSGEDL
jgi:very-short-patch-repair endonuclease